MQHVCNPSLTSNIKNSAGLSGQVELEGSELMRLSKVVQNATADRCGDFTVECGSGEVRLPDHFPHFLPTPEASHNCWNAVWLCEKTPSKI